MGVGVGGLRGKRELAASGRGKGGAMDGRSVGGEDAGWATNSTAAVYESDSSGVDIKWTPDRIAELKCVDRGEGLKPMHIYLDGSGKCECGQGPNLSEQRMR